MVIDLEWYQYHQVKSEFAGSIKRGILWILSQKLCLLQISVNWVERFFLVGLGFVSMGFNILSCKADI